MYDQGAQWPHLREGNYDFVGSGKAAGFNINVPLNKQGLGDTDYMAIFQQIFLPVAFEVWCRFSSSASFMRS